MNKRTSIFSQVAELEMSGNAGALCMVISSKGSTPRRAGAKMIVYHDGSITGTVGGGELENRVRHAALECDQNGRPVTLSYTHDRYQNEEILAFAEARWRSMWNPFFPHQP